jgi:ABC-type polysaccharide/polyol phosphate export permease
LVAGSKSAKGALVVLLALMLISAIHDVLDGLGRASLWTLLGWHDVRQRYRRSTLGPFWITLATTLFIGVMTFVYSGLFNQNIETFLPFVASGLVVWALISTCLIEGANVFVGAAPVIKQVSAPLPVHVFRLMWQQVIYFLHNALVLIPVILFTTVPVTPATLLIVPGFALLVVNLTWMILLLGTLGARFRDVPAIVASFIAALFIVTEVIWPVSLLPPDRRWIAWVNPFSYLIDVVRLPTMGTYPDFNLWLICIGLAVGGWVLALAAFARARNRLAFWI